MTVTEWLVTRVLTVCVWPYEELVPYSTRESAGSSVCQATVADAAPGDAVTVEITGGVESPG